MNRIILITLTAITLILSSCKKDNTGIDTRISAHYMFKTGTYWVYQHNNIVDSMYVTATGSKNGMPYMQITDVISRGHTVDSVHTIYIGAGPHSNQLQIWGYNFNGNANPQVIFQIDTPGIGANIGQGCYFSGIINMSGQVPQGVQGVPVTYGIEYAESGQNQEYGNIDYFFYPDFGIVQIEAYNTPWGDLYLNLKRSHIIQ